MKTKNNYGSVNDASNLLAAPWGWGDLFQSINVDEPVGAPSGRYVYSAFRFPPCERGSEGDEQDKVGLVSPPPRIERRGAEEGSFNRLFRRHLFIFFWSEE